jgi:hypothetical protein
MGHVRRASAIVVASVGLLALLACARSGEATDAAIQATADAMPDAGADATPPALPHRDLYETIQATAVGFACEGGDWADDFGDACYYGPAFFRWAGQAYGRPDYLALADQGLGHDLDVVRRSNADSGYFFAHLEDGLMAALGLLEDIGLTGDAANLPDLEAYIDQIDKVVKGFKLYLDVPVQTYALDTYGPTTNTAVMALLNLRYAELLDTPREAERVQFGQDVLATIDARAWNGSYYRFRPDDDWLEIYPNISMIVANGTAFRVTGDPAYRDRAVAAHRGIQPLKDPKGGYHSPYSAATMGATTDDYETLSAQNYTLLALARLFEITGHAAYRDEIPEILAFLDGWLLVDGRLLHHWIDGRVAIPSDPEYFCSGCNLQFLYVMLYCEQLVYGGR